MPQVIPANLRPSSWTRVDGRHCVFQPHGRRGQVGLFPNRQVWESDETWAARLFVGFNVGPRTVHDMDDLVAIVRAVRERQTGNPSSSFLYQRGIYRHHDGAVVDEPGAQVIIINMGATPAQFRRDMIDLAEAIAVALTQEEVVVELQKNGVMSAVMGVAAGE